MIRTVQPAHSYSSAFVCITAYQGKHDLSTPLSTAINAIHAWRIPNVTLAVITQDIQARGVLYLGLVSRLVPRWNRNKARVLRVVAPVRKPSPMLLAWHHRELMERELDRYDLFAYLEHDMEMRWEHVEAWARDEELLSSVPAPTVGLGWRRGFYRWYARYTRAAAGVPETQQEEQLVVPERFFADGNPCRATRYSGGVQVDIWRCKVQVGGRKFVGLPLTYAGAWLMGKARLERLLLSSQWTPDRRGNVDGVLLGPRETVASGDAFLNFTYGGQLQRETHCLNGFLVPYRTDACGREDTCDELMSEAGLRHLVQRYPFETPVTQCMRPDQGRDTWKQVHSSLQLNFSGRPCVGCTLITRSSP
jgi:hypothetical protein